MSKVRVALEAINHRVAEAKHKVPSLEARVEFGLLSKYKGKALRGFKHGNDEISRPTHPRLTKQIEGGRIRISGNI